MLGALRRCPTSVRWTSINLSASANSLSIPSRPRLPRLLSQQDSPAILSVRRHLHGNAKRPQQSAAAVAIEADVESELNHSRPPPDAEIDRAVAMGRLTKFQELADEGLVDPRIIRTLTKKMRFENMTQVQSLTVSEALKGVDVVAQAKTGTGKTIAFVLPILQNIISNDPDLAKRHLRAPRRNERTRDIRAIIISPTRELAEQIAEETRKLVEDTGVVVQCAVGGTQKNLHLRQMRMQGCHILVGTPGRLKDILSDPDSGVSAPMLSSLTLDEADRLMDQGFWPEIQEIQELLPNRQELDRQTLLFSATMSREVQQLARSVLKRDLHFVQTVQENESPTHERVPQNLVTVPSLENLLPAVLELSQREIDARRGNRSVKPFKAIVYFASTAEAQLASEAFKLVRQNQPSANQMSSETPQQSKQWIFPSNVYEIHSRLSQSQRTRAADMFRNSTSAILMSSDVTSRGMDFPNVTHVIQVGLPQDRDGYIHRLGRTARAGAEGEGWLIIPEMSVREASQRLGRLPLQKDVTLESATVDYTKGVTEAETSMTPRTAAVFETLRGACRRLSGEEFHKTYLAMLGTHQWLRDKDWLLTSMERMAKTLWGMDQAPSVPPGLATKLGLTGSRGLNSGRDRNRSGFGGSGGSRFGGGRRSEGSSRFGGGGSSSGDRSFGRRPDSGFSRDSKYGGGGRNDWNGGGGRSGDRERGSFTERRPRYRD